MIVISNGMLRSGSTLQYNIAAMLIESRGSLHRAGFMGDFAKPEALEKLGAMKRAAGWTIVKTHEAPLPREFYDDRVRVLYSYRDVRDIAASIRKKWNYPFEMILSQINAMIEIEAAFAKIPDVLVQPYELLFRDIPTATRQIAGYLCVDTNDNDVFKIAKALSLNTLRNSSGKSSGLLKSLFSRIVKRGFDRKTLLHADHISRSVGMDGDWVNQFAESEIAKLESQYSAWLNSHGYITGSGSAGSPRQVGNLL